VISVLVPLYDTPEARRCIESVIERTYSKLGALFRRRCVTERSCPQHLLGICQAGQTHQVPPPRSWRAHCGCTNSALELASVTSWCF